MKNRTRWIVIALVLLLVVPALGMAAWTWATLHVSYSEGDRAGVVQKISRKGWVCKTWEGELAMAPVPGAAPQLFNFTVPEASVAEQIIKTSGTKVILAYEQHRFVPSSCFGETEYFVTGVKPAAVQ